MSHSDCTRSCQPVQDWPADQHGIGSQRKAFERVRAPPNPAVDEDRDCSIDFRDDGGQHFYGSRHGIENASAMIRYDHTRSTVLDGQLSILWGKNSF